MILERYEPSDLDERGEHAQGQRVLGAEAGSALAQRDVAALRTSAPPEKITHTRPAGGLIWPRRRQEMPERGKELYRSPNGDRWLLIRETLSDRVLVRHEPNLPSGGKASVVEVGDFLSRGNGPEQQALLRLIGSLVEAGADATTGVSDD